MEKNIFVAADLGNSKLRLMAAEHTSDGLVSVLAMEDIDTPEESIQNGVIKKPTEIATKLREMAAKLQNRIENIFHEKYQVDGLYLGINGRTLRTIRANVKRTFPGSTEITKTELASLKKELCNQVVEGREIYYIFEEEYLIDGKLVRSADGIVCEEIQANYVVAYGRTDVSENLNKCIERSCFVPEGETLAPIAIADAVLTDEDRQLGCAVLNFGAATTTVSVYQDGFVRHAAVVPFGGKHITEDLKYLQITSKDAERMKISCGNAELSPESTSGRVRMTVAPGAEPRFLDMKDVTEIINARLSEIVSLCMTEIEKSQFIDKLQNGLVVTGGASRLKNFVPFLNSATKMQVRVGSHSQCLDEESKTLYSDTEYALLIGLLKNATEPCMSVKVPQTESKPVNNIKTKHTAKTKFRNLFDNFFSGAEDTITEE